MRCERCQGFKVLDCLDVMLHCSGYRCVNCGAITDMQIAMAAQTRRVIPPPGTRPVDNVRSCAWRVARSSSRD